MRKRFKLRTIYAKGINHQVFTSRRKLVYENWLRYEIVFDIAFIDPDYGGTV